MSLTDWAKLAGPALALPVNGKTYVVPPITAAAGIALQTIPEDMAAADFYKHVLGDKLHAELIKDNVADTALALIGRVAWADYTLGREAAEALWEANGDPNRLRPTPKPRRSRASGSTTQSPGSGTPTTTRATTRRASRSTT